MSDMKYKYELNMKFSFFLWKMMIQKYLKINFFQKFSTYFNQMIQTFKKINRAENCTCKSDQLTKEISNVLNILKYLILSDNEWAQLFLEKKCFICKKSNHMSRNCSEWSTDDKITEFKFLKKQMQNQTVKQIKKKL